MCRRIDEKIAALLGTDAAAITVTDLAVHPKTRNAFIAVMRGQGTDARPALIRVDGDGRLEAVALDQLQHTRRRCRTRRLAPTGAARRNPRADSITDMAFVNGRLIVAGLSNEEFASKLRTIAYPFTAVEPGTSVEIYHGNHGALETRSPVYAFVPYTVGQHAALDRRLPLHAAREVPGQRASAGTQKVVGTTIARARRRQPAARHDRLQEGRQGVPADVEHQPRRDEDPDRRFRRRAAPITARVGGTAGVPYETIATMTGVVQMDLLDTQR